MTQASLAAIDIRHTVDGFHLPRYNLFPVTGFECHLSIHVFEHLQHVSSDFVVDGDLFTFWHTKAATQSPSRCVQGRVVVL
jgi:hypothetical protein